MSERYAALELVDREDEVIWLDRPDAIDRISAEVPSDLVPLVTSLVVNGWARIERMHDAAVIDAALDDYRRFCRKSGLHEPEQRSRIYFIEQESDAFREILMNARLMDVLGVVFGREAILYASQVFERGSQQAIHRDSPFFHTRPFGHFVGVWHALEDVHAEAGPLAYYPGGHRLPAPPVRAWWRDEADRDDRAVFDRLLARFDRTTLADCEAAGIVPETLLARRGDVFLWHPWLPHGGTPILDPARSRMSIVGHYIPVGTDIFNVDVFFGQTDPTTAERELAVQTWSNRLYVNQGPAFVPTSYLPDGTT